MSNIYTKASAINWFQSAAQDVDPAWENPDLLKNVQPSISIVRYSRRLNYDVEKSRGAREVSVQPRALEFR